MIEREKWPDRPDQPARTAGRAPIMPTGIPRAKPLGAIIVTGNASPQN
jgi:hypothetical protein